MLKCRINKIPFLLLLLVCISSAYHTNAQISDSLHAVLPDSLRPADRMHLTNKDRVNILAGHVIFLGLNRMEAELDGMAYALDTSSARQSRDSMITLKLGVAKYLYGRSGDYDSVLRYYNNLYRLIGNDNKYKSQLAKLYMLSGNIYTSKGAPEEGITVLLKALDMYKEMEDSLGIGLVYAQLNTLYSTLFMFDEAMITNESYFRYAYSGHSDNKNILAVYLMTKGEILLNKYEIGGDIAMVDSADVTIDRAFRELRSDAGLWYSYLFLQKGIAWYYRGQYQAALDCIDASDKPEYNVVTLFSNVIPAKQVYRGLCFIAIGRKEEGRKLLEDNVVSSSGIALSQMVTEYLYRDAAARGDYRQALKWHELYKAYDDSMNIAIRRGKVFEVNQRYSVVRKDAEIKLLALDTAEKRNQRNLAVLIAIAAGAVLTVVLLLLRNRNRRYKQSHAEAASALIAEKQRREEEMLLQEMQAQVRQNEAILKQRQQISEDMHDEVSGQLAALRYYIMNIRKSSDNESTIKLMTEVEEASAAVYDTARRFMHQLHTSTLELQPRLMDFLLEQTRLFAQEHSLNIDIQLAGEVNDHLTVEQQCQLTRILREAIANIVKHANATQARIKISVENTTCYFSVADNGHGFDPAADNAGMGLPSMEHRMQALQGGMTLYSDGTGTVISGWFPVA